MSQKIEELARKYALANAVEHGGKANAGSIVGMIMGKHQDLNPDPRDVGQILGRLLAEINAMTPEEQLAMLTDIAPELLEKEVRERRTGLPELEGAGDGVVMRLAPNPSGPLHIGHTRMAILNDEYVKRYGGKLIVRMEDTNPEAILPEAYDMILANLDFLEVEYHEVICQSERFETYYEWAEKILELGKGYMCTCESEVWRELKDQKRACRHRDTPAEDNIELWRKMLSGHFEQGEISMVVKTDIEHPNPAVRDFVAMRIMNASHPKTGDDYHVLPLYNFSVAIDDYLMGMTHVLRGKDHLNNTLRQEYVYDHLGWKKPRFHHYGWVSIDDTELSTRRIKASIEEGKFRGWDDVRLGTVAALAKRGIQPGAIRKYWIEVGTKAVDIRFSWDNLYSYNREIIDKLAHRYFFVWDPVVIKIEGTGRLIGSAPLLPDNPDSGAREFNITADESDGQIYLQITETDLSEMRPGSLIRLKDLGNVEYMGEKRFKYIGDDLSILKQGARIIHWVGPENVTTKTFMPDGERIEGIAESAARNAAGQTVQFERFGFVRLEMGDGGLVGFFAHK